jgi:hypothetical protein
MTEKTTNLTELIGGLLSQLDNVGIRLRMH